MITYKYYMLSTKYSLLRHNHGSRGYRCFGKSGSCSADVFSTAAAALPAPKRHASSSLPDILCVLSGMEYGRLFNKTQEQAKAKPLVPFYHARFCRRSELRPNSGAKMTILQKSSLLLRSHGKGSGCNTKRNITLESTH